jgi:hypothetical protein
LLANILLTLLNTVLDGKLVLLLGAVGSAISLWYAHTL